METFPYDHLVIDDFFPLDKAKKLSEEYPTYDSPVWFQYKTPLENKKSCKFLEESPTSYY